MGQIFVKASRRAKAYTRRQQQAIRMFTPMNRKPVSALRALKSSNRFISYGHGTFGQRRHLLAAAKVDRSHIRQALSQKLKRGARTSVYKRGLTAWEDRAMLNQYRHNNR